MSTHEPDRAVWRKSSHSASNGGCVEVTWRKSSYSASNGDCVEVGWRKSSHSASNGACVEVSHRQIAVSIRDSKNATSPILTVPVTSWTALLSQV